MPDKSSHGHRTSVSEQKRLESHVQVFIEILDGRRDESLVRGIDHVRGTHQLTTIARLRPHRMTSERSRADFRVGRARSRICNPSPRFRELRVRWSDEQRGPGTRPAVGVSRGAPGDHASRAYRDERGRAHHRRHHRRGIGSRGDRRGSGAPARHDQGLARTCGGRGARSPRRQRLGVRGGSPQAAPARHRLPAGASRLER